MKKAAIFFSTIFLSAVLYSQGNTRENRDVKGFDRISYGISGSLKVSIGPEFKVVLEGDKDDIREVITEVSDGRLRIRMSNWRFSFNEKVNVWVTLPELTGLSVSGSGNAEVLDPLRNLDDLNLNVSGSGKLKTAEVVTGELDCSISGSGDIFMASGNADHGDISISGSGSYSGPDFEIDDLEVRVSGSGSCLCRAGNSIRAGISGSGNVTYNGNPEKIDARVSGSGHIRKAK
jgi:hypothetical protein